LRSPGRSGESQKERLRVKQKRDEGTGLLEERGGQNILTRNVGENGFRPTFQHMNQWMKRFEYVVESGEEYYTK
jgi:hypothetical protein